MKPDRPLLTPFQLEVARPFFSVPAGHAFLLPVALPCASRNRPTDQRRTWTSSLRAGWVTSRGPGMSSPRPRARGWTVEHLERSSEFGRMLIDGQEDELVVDLALDSRPGMPATASVAGPTFAPEELAGRKLIALFDRAAARDFVDALALARLFGKPALLARAAMIDLGFDTQVLAAMFAHLDAYPMSICSWTHTSQTCPLRTFFADGRQSFGALSCQQVVAALAAV